MFVLSFDTMSFLSGSEPKVINVLSLACLFVLLQAAIALEHNYAPPVPLEHEKPHLAGGPEDGRMPEEDRMKLVRAVTNMYVFLSR